MQLQYFGEAFDRNQCGAMKGMECDNCIKRDKGDPEPRHYGHEQDPGGRSHEDGAWRVKPVTALQLVV